MTSTPLRAVLLFFFLAHLAIAQERAELPRAKKGKVDEYLAALKKAGLPSRPPLITFSALEVGDVGKLPYAYDSLRPEPFISTTILQILDGDEMLVTVKLWGWKAVAMGVVPIERDSTVVLFRGVSTKDQADDKKFAIGGGFHISGTYKYSTTAGQRTVYVLEPMDLPKIPDERGDPREELLKKVAADRDAASKAAASTPAEPDRMWKDKDGKELGRGDLVSFKRGFVELQIDGKKKTLSLAQLSKEDRDWVRINAGKK